MVAVGRPLLIRGRGRGRLGQWRLRRRWPRLRLPLHRLRAALPLRLRGWVRLRLLRPPKRRRGRRIRSRPAVIVCRGWRFGPPAALGRAPLQLLARWDAARSGTGWSGWRWRRKGRRRRRGVGRGRLGALALALASHHPLSPPGPRSRSRRSHGPRLLADGAVRRSKGRAGQAAETTEARAESIVRSPATAAVEGRGEGRQAPHVSVRRDPCPPARDAAHARGREERAGERRRECPRSREAPHFLGMCMEGGSRAPGSAPA
jgi:hypothetical protein